jgi:nicotinamide riboside transporter PnuC
MSINADVIAQVGIPIFGFSAMFLVARKNKWGFVLGLLAQPFWFFTAYTHDQWGIILNSIVYSAIWVYGIYKWFWGEKAIDKPEETR